MRNLRQDFLQYGNGFTLIELMVAVAIVSFLAAIALPQYQVYAIRSQVARVMGEVGALRAAVEICLSEGRTSGLGAAADECDPGATGSNLMTNPGAAGAAPTLTLLSGVGVPAVVFPAGGGASITATFGNSAAVALAGYTVRWTFSPVSGWACSASVPVKFGTVACS